MIHPYITKSKSISMSSLFSKQSNFGKTKPLCSSVMKSSHTYGVPFRVADILSYIPSGVAEANKHWVSSTLSKFNFLA